MQGDGGQRADEEKGKAAAAEEEEAVVLLPHELVAWEVLTRLPAKYLMRFKCVSKLWGSTISKDPAFSKAHRARQRSGSSLFITCPDADDSLSCFYATRNDSHPSCKEEEEKSSFVVSKPHRFTTSCRYEGATEVINGLFCLHARNRAWICCICNVSTREIRELPSSDLARAIFFKYYFGFAASTNEYKLLKLCLLELLPMSYKGTNVLDCHHSVCEILTMSKDLTWRRPSTLLDNQRIELESDRQTSVYIDGSLCCWRSGVYSLIVFNFEDEGVQEIDLPPKARGGSRISSRFDGYGLLVITAAI